MSGPRLLGAVEAGGTKFVCAVGPEPGVVVARERFHTRGPEATLADVLGFFAAHGPVAALGVGSFGPLELDPLAAQFGCITKTPKPGWSGVDLRGRLAGGLGCPVAIDTDVNASGLAEAVAGAGAGCAVVAYVTVGTGIGGGLIVDGRPLHGMSHPEMGHILPRRLPGDTFDGCCPFHGDCLEGLASGAAIFARAGVNLDALPQGGAVWDWVGGYLGQLCAQLVLMAAPQRIVLGGGVLESNPALFAAIRTATQGYLAGYVACRAIIEAIGTFIVPPAFGAAAGIRGAMMLAAGQLDL